MTATLGEIVVADITFVPVPADFEIDAGGGHAHDATGLTDGGMWCAPGPASNTQGERLLVRLRLPIGPSWPGSTPTRGPGSPGVSSTIHRLTPAVPLEP